MGALLDYRLADLLMFSPTIYYRLLERYNLDIWPLQIVALGLGLLLLRLMLRDKGLNRRIAGAVLAIGWLWSGLVFNYLNFASINWIAGYLAFAYVAEGLLLFLWGYLAAEKPEGDALLVRSDIWPLRRVAGTGLVAIAVFGYPFLYLLTGEAWQTAQIFLTSPGPTMVATLGLLLTVRSSLAVAFGLSIIPLTVLLVEGLTLFTLGSVDWMVLAGAGALTLVTWMLTALGGMGQPVTSK